MSALSSIFGQIATLGGEGKKRRRVTDGIDDLDDEYVPDVSRTAQEENLPPPGGGGSLPAQQSDIRQNQIIDPERQKNRQAMESLGRGLGSYVMQNNQPDEEESAPLAQPELPDQASLPQMPQTPITEEAPPSPMASEEQKQRQLMEKISRVRSMGAPRNQYGLAPTPEIPPVISQIREETAAQEEQTRVDRNRIMDAVEHPFEQAVPGAASEVSASPEMQEKLKELTGAVWNEPTANAATDAESVISTINEDDSLLGGLKQEQKDLRARIKAGEATDSDKYMIGLALALPLIIGGFYGAEAGFSALGGAGKGLGEAFDRRSKENQSNRELLSDVNKQIGATEETQRKANVSPIAGMQIIRREDPESGQQVELAEILPGLAVPVNMIHSQDDIKEIKKVSREMSSAKGYAINVTKAAKDISDIASQVKDKRNFQEAAIAIMNGDQADKFIKLLSDDVIVDGKKINAGVALKTRLGLLAVDYAKSHKLGQIDAALQRHLQQIFSNPATTFRTGEDLIHQMDTLVDFTLENIIDSAKSQGFDSEYLKEDLKKETKGYHHGKQKREDVKINNERLPGLR